MKTKLQIALSTLAPSILIRTFWQNDWSPDMTIFHAGNGLSGEKEDDWECHQSEVRATAIVHGDEVKGCAYLGGTWERAGDNPAKVNPDISGYERQMTVEALGELCEELKKLPMYPVRLIDEIVAALSFLNNAAAAA